jgi:hypothetical protein
MDADAQDGVLDDEPLPRGVDAGRIGQHLNEALDAPQSSLGFSQGKSEATP